MGTSKAYGGLKGSPTWGPLSSTVSRAVNRDCRELPKKFSTFLMN